MSYLTAAPEIMEAATTDLASIGLTLSAAHMAVGAPTLALLPAAADEVSASIAHLFSRYGDDYQKLAEQAAAFHEQFVQRLTTSAGSYASAEAANASLLQPLAASGVSVGANVPLLDQLFNLATTYWNSLLSQVSLNLWIPLSQLFLPSILIFLPSILIFFPSILLFLPSIL